MIVTGAGHRTPDSFEGAPAGAAWLHVEYTNGTVSVPGPGSSGSSGLAQLGPVFPNPGSGAATVRFELMQQSQVRLELYDVRGALVRRIVDAMRAPGMYTASWDGRDQHGSALSSGVYLLRFAAGPYRETRRLVVLHEARATR